MYHNNTEFPMSLEKVKEERTSVLSSIYLFNKSKLTYYSVNYLFIAKVAGVEMRQRNNEETAEQSTPKVKNTKPTKTKSILHNNMLFRDAVVLPLSLFRILYHRIAPDRTSNGSNSTGQ